MKPITHIAFVSSVLLFTLFSYLFIDPNFSSLQMFYSGIAFTQKPVVTILYIIFLVATFGFYYFYIRKSSLLSMQFYKKLFLALITVSLFAYPAMLSYDIFNYSTTARVLFYYQENPYIIMPIAFTDDAFLTYTRAANKVALYGPVWLGITGIPYMLGFNNLLLILFNIKLLVASFYAGTLVLIWYFTKSKKAVVLFGLNPLILMHTLMSGHNDIVMMFFALLAYFFLLKKKYIFVIIFLLFSVLIKYATIFLVPVVCGVIISQIFKRKIIPEKIYFVSAGAMFFIFLLSTFREEIYPWYATWFLVFTSLLSENKKLQILTFVFSFSFLLRDVPYMYSGTYLGATPMLKTFLSAVPVLFVALYLLIKKITEEKLNISVAARK